MRIRIDGIKLVLWLLALCGATLYGSLIATAVTNNPSYFLYGYPVSVVLLVMAGSRRKNRG